jgi:DNA-binding MarR family transcriptional regulator
MRVVEQLLEYRRIYAEQIAAAKNRWNPTQRAILDALTDEPLTIAKLAEKTGINQSTLTKNIKDLCSYDGINVIDNGRHLPRLYSRGDSFESIYG